MKPFKQAFTLIELIIVISILGVMLIVATPSFVSKDGMEQYIQLRLLRDKIRFATEYNIQTGMPVRLTFTPLAGSGTNTIEMDYKDALAGWVPLQVMGEASPLYLQLGEGEFSQLNLTEVNINLGNILILDALGQPRDQNGNLLQGAMNRFFKINAGGIYTIYPVTVYLELS